MGSPAENKDDKQTWLCGRLKDILKAKGYSYDTMSQKGSFSNAMEVCRYVNGEKPITPHVLQKFCSGLHLSHEQIMQTYAHHPKIKIEKALSNEQKVIPAEESVNIINLAADLVAKSLGISEKADALITLGKVYEKLGRFENAYTSWSEAYKVAIKGADGNILFHALNNHMKVLLAEGKHEEVLKMLGESRRKLDPQILKDPEKKGKLLHFKGLCLYKVGKRHEAKEVYKECYGCYKETRNSILIGRALHNIADIEFLDGNTQKALKYLRTASSLLKIDSLEMQLTVAKDLSRALIATGFKDDASKIINRNLIQIKEIGYDKFKRDLVAKYMLMKAVVDNDICAAEEIFELGTDVQEVLIDASNFLLKKYLELGDCESAMKYYSIMKELLDYEKNNFEKGAWL